jgi:non-specific serine/threonine protein kinase
MYTLNSETLNEDRLKKAVDFETFNLGQKMFLEGKVRIVESSSTSALCIVQDKRNYHVVIKIVEDHVILKCSCPHASRGLVCEHDVASWLGLREHMKKAAPDEWRTRVSRLLDAIQTTPQRKTSNPYLLFFCLHEDADTDSTSWRISPILLSPGAIPRDLLGVHGVYQPQELSQYIEAHKEISLRARPPYHALDPGECLNCASESVNLANLILEGNKSNLYDQNLRFLLDDYLALMHTTKSLLFLGTSNEPLQKALEILPQPGEARLNLERDEEGLHITIRFFVSGQVIPMSPNEIQVIQTSPTWILADRCLFKLENQVGIELINQFKEISELFVPSSGELAFWDKYLLELARRMPLEGNAVSWETISAEPVSRLYLSDSNGELQVQLRFGYGEMEVKYDMGFPAENLQRKPDQFTLVRILRQPEAEKSAYDPLPSVAFRLKRAPLPAQPGLFRLRARVHPVDFLLNTLPHIKNAGYEIYGEEQLKIARVNRNKATISFDVSSEIDWFDLKAVVNFGKLEVKFNEIRRAMRKRERYIKLADGSIGEIPEDWFEQYKVLFALGETSGDSLRFSHHHLVIIDQVLASADKSTFDVEFNERREKLRALGGNFKGIASKELPEFFYGEMRPYQKAGYDWLHFLHGIEFGGCLADDMGLGKTIQALAFLLSLYQGVTSDSSPKQASLLVVPRSLLVNWQREAARFTPRLRILEFFQTDRPKDPLAFSQVDLVLTTYGIMLRDIQTLHRYTFYYAILDESQAIKNPLSQTARAAHLLQAEHRLVLTGTPIENSTSELWSQFHFLNPGLLGNLKYFKKEFSSPIEKKGDENTVQVLRRMVYPFIMRRTKDQVAPELPPRTERILYSDMDSAQSKLYNRTRDYFRGLLLGMLEKESLDKSRMKILEGLLRLRQIANHPLLFDEKFRGSSGKFELLMDTLETLRVEGHKALVFSQFVQMLKLVRMELDQRNIVYTYLDGHTRDRQAQIDTFQSDLSIPFFLISLKAGGLGLNLTAADYVIHIDPWWNPAVETQASDRTHRIGQEKPVFIFKLIARDTVEEKILVLQERKKNLVDQIITTESAFFKSLTKEDVQALFS